MSDFRDILVQVSARALGRVLLLNSGLTEESATEILSESIGDAVPGAAVGVFKKASERRKIRRLPRDIAEAVTETLVDQADGFDAEKEEWLDFAAANLEARARADSGFLLSVATSPEIRRDYLATLSQSLGSNEQPMRWFETYLDRVAVAAQSLPGFSTAALTRILNQEEQLHELLRGLQRSVESIRGDLIGAGSDELASTLGFQRRAIIASSGRSRLIGVGSEGIISSLPLDETFVRLRFDENGAKDRVKGDLEQFEVSDPIPTASPKIELIDQSTLYPDESPFVFTRSRFGGVINSSDLVAQFLNSVQGGALVWAPKPERRLDDLDVLVSRCSQPGSKLLLVAEAGSGKTTSMQHVARSVVSRGDSSSVVLFVRLRDVVRFEPSISCVVDNSLGASEIGEAGRTRLIEAFLEKSRTFVLLLDGVDELDGARMDDFLEMLRFIQDEAPMTVSITVTSRPDSRLREVDFRGFAFSQVLPLRSEDIASYCEKFATAMERHHGRERQSLLNTLMRGLLSNPEILEVVSRPLFLALYCGVVERETRDGGSEAIAIRSKHDLLQVATRLMCGQREVAKANRFISMPSANQTRWIMQSLAKWMTAEGLVAVSRDRMVGRLSEALRSLRDLEAQWTGQEEDLLDLLIDRSGILREFTRGRIEFIHKAFQDVLAGWEYQRTDSVADLVRVYRDGRSISDALLAAAADATEPQLREIVGSLCGEGSTAGDKVVALRLVGMREVMSPQIRDLVDAAASSLLPPGSQGTLIGLAAVGDVGYRVLSDWLTSADDEELLVRADDGRSVAEMIAEFLGASAAPSSLSAALTYLQRTGGAGGNHFAQLLRDPERMGVAALMAEEAVKLPVLEWSAEIESIGNVVAEIGVVRDAQLDRHWSGVSGVLLCGSLESDRFLWACRRAASEGRLVGVCVEDVGQPRGGRGQHRARQIEDLSTAGNRRGEAERRPSLTEFVHEFSGVPLFAQSVVRGARPNFNLEARLSEVKARYAHFLRCRPAELRIGGAPPSGGLMGVSIFDNGARNSKRVDLLKDVPEIRWHPREPASFGLPVSGSAAEEVVAGVRLQSVREAWLYLLRSM